MCKSGRDTNTQPSGAVEGFLTEYSELPALVADKPSKEQRAAKLSMLLLALAGTGSGALSSTAQAEAIGYGGPLELSIIPEVPSVTVGVPIVADVSLSNLNNNLIGSYDLTVFYDPALLSVATVSFGTFLDGPDNSIQGTSIASGSLEAFEVSLGSLSTQSGFGTLPLFDITFNSLAAGTSPLTFDTVSNGGPILGDQNGNSFTNFSIVDSIVSILPNDTGPGGGGIPGAPEIDPASAAGALTLLAGSLFVMSARRKQKVGENPLSDHSR